MAESTWVREGGYQILTTPTFTLFVLEGQVLEAPIDVTVELLGGSRKVATFFTLESIAEIMKSYGSSGELLHGQYFWSSFPIFVRSMNLSAIEAVVQDLIDSNEIATAFGDA